MLTVLLSQAVTTHAQAQSAPIPAAPVAPTVTLETTQPENASEPLNAQSLKSLFFTPEQVRNINYAANIYRKNAQGRSATDEFDEEDFLSRLTSIKQTPQTNRYYEYPQFFLDSIVYHAADNWIIWVNSQKITQATPNENSDLKVEAIDQDKVTFLWRPASMDKINEVWEKSPNDSVKVSRRAGTVEFAIRPNQTFSSYVMRTIEGKVKPVTIDTHAINIVEEPPPADDQANPAPDAGTPENNQGLGGLIGAYQRLGDTGAAENPPTGQSNPATSPAAAPVPAAPIPAP